MTENLIAPLPSLPARDSTRQKKRPKGGLDMPAVPLRPAPDIARTIALDERVPAAHALVRALVLAGVDTFFGIPGGAVSPVFDAVLQTPGARLIESRQESSAAFAAASFHRVTGRVPCVVVTAGPGATNVATGVASAHTERVPMLVICGVVANLIAARSRGMLTPGAIVALYAQGAGFSRAAALIRW